ncbi:MAG: hypothetical protein EA427_00615 [Spirochaetaceae bacterium]|nr:MAG: hypothetical protein EA427_00615 [Spirochaetaceae bacterium]
MTEFHEPVEILAESTRNYIRAINSLKEELEAVDWYQQRIDGATDVQLKQILAHNRDEEMEHACMSLEWLRRNMPGWDEALRTYLFTEGNITELEEHATGGHGVPRSGSAVGGDLGIGRPKRGEQEWTS